MNDDLETALRRLIRQECRAAVREVLDDTTPVPPPGDDPPDDPPVEPPGDGAVWLSDLEPFRTHAVKIGPMKDVSGYVPHRPIRIGHLPIRINGRVHPRGVSWFPEWGPESFVEWDLGGEYSRLRATVRFDDSRGSPKHYPSGEWGYEWARITPDGGFVGVNRPGHFLDPENPPAHIRIGAGGTVEILGDGRSLLQTPELYGYGDPEEVDLDVSGVQKLRVALRTTHHEQPDAPHRRGLTEPVLIQGVGWFDLLSLGSARLLR